MSWKPVKLFFERTDRRTVLSECVVPTFLLSYKVATLQYKYNFMVLYRKLRRLLMLQPM